MENDDNVFKLTWFEETQHLETIREAQEWVESGAFNEIGYLFDGYKSTDPKFAYALLFELVRSNTIHEKRYDIFCDYDYIDGQTIYKVWVSKPNS
ncbi:hypothetical protein AB4Z22_41605 [Paenibacillus sp. TAF58]